MMLRVVDARERAEHSDWFKQRDRCNAESIPGAGRHSRLRTMLLGNFSIKRHSSLNLGNTVIASALC